MPASKLKQLQGTSKLSVQSRTRTAVDCSQQQKILSGLMSQTHQTRI